MKTEIRIFDQPSQQRKPAMKKYYQLILIIVSVTSFITLLFYRHEYNRLRYVLEVLNFFGKPGQSTTGADYVPFNISHSIKASQIVTNPFPSWQRLTDSHFIYSAFLEKSGRSQQVKALSIELGKSHPKFECKVWFEDMNEPVLGRFSYTILKSSSNIDSNITGYNLFCKPKQIQGLPVGVTFYKTEPIVPSSPFIPIYTSVENLADENSTAICLVPYSPMGLKKSSVIEFISYHQLIGVNNFISYDGSNPNKIITTLQNPIVQESYNFHFSLLNWNFPFPLANADSLYRSLIENDCIQRVSHKVRNVAVLTWDDFIVPRYHHTLSGMLDDFDSKRKTTARFEIPTLVFCTDLFESFQENMPQVLRKTRFYKGNGVPPPLYVYRTQGIDGKARGMALTTQRVSAGIAAVHQYIKCDLDTAQQTSDVLVMDKSMLRFAGDLNRSKLLKLA